MILFGSSLHDQFVLDSVLAVAGWLEHEKCDDLLGRTDGARMNATIKPMYGWGDNKQTYRLYLGATPDEPVDGMFSFVPCRPAAGRASGFGRPAIQLQDLLNPSLRMQARTVDVGKENIPQLWQAVVDAVLAEGLALATHLQLDQDSSTS